MVRPPYQPPREALGHGWGRCRAAVEDTTGLARCEYRRGHTGDHAAERGMYWLTWSSIVSVL